MKHSLSLPTGSGEPIANRVAASASILGRLAPAKIYKGTSPGSGADRNVYDGAIGRSYRASFHAQGYPAVVVSEDFFINQSGEPPADGNPDYHRNTDTVIDSAYGRISRVPWRMP